MKRPTRHKAGTLRVGEMIFFARLVRAPGRVFFEVGTVQVGPDRQPQPDPGQIYDQLPRWWLRACLTAWPNEPAFRTRRAAQRECNRLNRRERW